MTVPVRLIMAKHLTILHPFFRFETMQAQQNFDNTLSFTRVNGGEIGVSKLALPPVGVTTRLKMTIM